MSRKVQKKEMIEDAATGAFKDKLDWTSHDMLKWLNANKSKQFTLTEVGARLGIMARQGKLIQTETRKHADRRYRSS
jgi:hypothetical protein